MSDERVRVEVAHPPGRCAFCHEDVNPDATDWIACAHCLARHHAECWGETGRCASCGRVEALGRLAAPPRSPVTATPVAGGDATAPDDRGRADRIALRFAWTMSAAFALMLCALIAGADVALALAALGAIAFVLARIGASAGGRRS